MAKREQSPLFFYVLLTAAAILVAVIARPIASALFLAAVLAGVLFSLQRRLTAVVKRKELAAGILVLGVIVIILGPLVVLSTEAVSQATSGVKYVRETLRSEGVTGLVHRLPASMQGLANSALERLSTDPNASVDQTVGNQIQAQTGKAAAVVGAVAMATGSLVFQATMMLIALYFLLIDGPRLVGWLDRTVPLRAGELRELLVEFQRVARAVIVSSAITAAIQALAALAGYVLAKVPNPLFFTGITFFVALIPAIGAAAVCLVAAALLYLTGHPLAALFLAIWGVAVVGLIDNIVKPYLVSDDMEMHGALVFFALIGGIAAFGAIGLLMGPLIANLFITLTAMYRRDYKPHPDPTRT